LASKKQEPKKKSLSTKKVKAKPEQPKPRKEPKEKMEEEPKISKVEEVHLLAKGLPKLEDVDRRIERKSEIGVAPLFSHARQKEKKCFAIGGLMTDIVNQLKAQTYGLAGTGFEVDGTPVTRAKGSNWEELYMQLLSFMATAEALGCTYQGDLTRLKSAKRLTPTLGEWKASQTEMSKAILDDLSTDLRKMTLQRSALGPRHSSAISDIDSKIKTTALEAQLASLEWDYGNYDRVVERKEKYDALSDAEKSILDKLLQKVKSGGTLTETEKRIFFYPPSKEELDKIRELKGKKEGKLTAINNLIADRDSVIKASYPTDITLRVSADKVVAGLNDILGNVFGNLEDEKGAMRTLLVDSLKTYSRDTKASADTLEALTADEKQNFAKILEILGRLRLARESGETVSADDYRIESNIRDAAAQLKEDRIIDGMSALLSIGARDEKQRLSSESFLDKLLEEAQKTKDQDDVELLKADLESVTETEPAKVDITDVQRIKAPKTSKPKQKKDMTAVGGIRLRFKVEE